MNNFTPDRPLVVFDGECGFCRAWVDYWRQLTNDKVIYVPYQEVKGLYPNVPDEDFASAVRLIMPSGEIFSSAHAVYQLLAECCEKNWPLAAYRKFPVFAAASEFAYRTIARHRTLCYWITRIFWGIPIEVETFQLASWIFMRALGAIYLIAFLSFGPQAAGLIGSRGISPIAEFLGAVQRYYGPSAYWNLPTLLWLGVGDAAIKAVWIAGACLAALFMLGLRWRILPILLFILYLSVVIAGQEFMGYQWDALLLEAGFLAIFIGSGSLLLWLYRWLLFRLMFSSGVVKLESGDLPWRHFTALPVHYQTQPLPTPLAWYMYQLPAWFQRFSVGFVFFVEIAVPFLVFAPRRARLFAARALILLQVLILLTGNYAFFNLLTIAFCLLLFDDGWLKRLIPKRATEIILKQEQRTTGGRPVKILCAVFAVLSIFAGTFEVLGIFGVRWLPASDTMRVIAPFELVNGYGLFAVMTTTRPEIMVEGSNDGTTWLPYEFKYKPGRLNRPPQYVAPYQPRLDWQMWFAALGDYQSDPWIVRFLGRLLEGSPDVLALLQHNPFPGAPPRYIRAMLYEYRFTTPAERKQTGDWWARELKGTYLPPVGLQNRP